MRSLAELERLRHHHGEAVIARDLRDETAREQRLGALHVCTAHGTWGVALGFDVRRSRDRRAVLLGPGIAYDRHGRAIVSSRTLTIPAPIVTSIVPMVFDLTIAYDTELTGRQEQPTWRWVRAGGAVGDGPPLSPTVRLGIEVPVARARVDAGGVIALDFSLRRHAHGLVRPHIAGGRVLQASVEVAGSPWCWRVKIDTSRAGFSSARPFYFASLAAHPLGPGSELIDRLGTDPAPFLRHVRGPFLAVQAPHTRHFRLEVRMGVTSAFLFRLLSGAADLRQRLRLPVAIDWVGLEPAGGCPP
jgi:hypothetical protein